MMFPKPTPPKRDRAHLAFVRRLPCCACGAPPPSEAHHFGKRGIGQKTDDTRTVPLCRAHHREWHRRADLASTGRDGAEARSLFDSQIEKLTSERGVL